MIYNILATIKSMLPGKVYMQLIITIMIIVIITMQETRN